jgi:hypothetical protein
MVVVTKFSEPAGPTFYYDPPTNETYGSGPPGVRDPYERKWLELVRRCYDNFILESKVSNNKMSKILKIQ